MIQRICILEPDEVTQQELSLALIADGYNLKMHSDGYTVFDSIGIRVDLYVINVNLRGINGMEICKWLKQQPDTGHVPILLLCPSPELQILASSCPADHVLSAPYTTDTILEIIHEMISISQEAS